MLVVKDSLRRVILTLTDASGRAANTAAPVARITTTGYDPFGNTIRELTASNRELALGTADWQLQQQCDLGVASDTPTPDAHSRPR